MNFDNVFAIVEVTSFEMLCLWQEWHQKRNYSWDENNRGQLITVGYIDSRPIAISVLIHKVNEREILFIEATSQLVDWKMIENWLYENVPSARNGTSLNKWDAGNFHCVVF